MIFHTLLNLSLLYHHFPLHFLLYPQPTHFTYVHPPLSMISHIPTSIDISSFSFFQSLFNHSKRILQTIAPRFFPKILNRINRDDR